MMQSDLDRAKKMLFVCDFRACMNACTCGLCSSVRSKTFLLAAGPGHSIRATFRVCHTHVVSLIFFVRGFDNKLQLAFDRVRCWFAEVLLTSQLGRWSRCREKRRLDFEECSTWCVALIFANCPGNSSSLHGLQNITT